MSFEKGTAADHEDLFQKLRTFVKAGSNAAQTLTLTANAANTETVTIGAKTYTFQSSLTNVDGNVLIGATMADSLNNLVAAINLDAGSGTTYAAATVTHPTARARRGTGNTLIASALTAGTGGNALATTETLGNGSWGAATMATGGGAAWTELEYESGTLRAVYEAPGLSGSEEIHIGFGVVEDNGADAYALTGWMFKAYNGALDLQAQPGNSGTRYHPVWDTTIPYWFIGNGQRVIVVTKISTVYTASYLGKFLPYGTPGEYPQPYIVSMPTDANWRWSTVSANIRNFWNPGPIFQFLNPNGTWFNGGNFFQSSSEQPTFDSYCYIDPYNNEVSNNQSTRTRWREVRDNIDGSYSLFPCRLTGDLPDLDWFGELDGAYAISGFSQASEDIIPVDNIKHLVVQDIARTNRWDYAAIKLE